MHSCTQSCGLRHYEGMPDRKYPEQRFYLNSFATQCQALHCEHQGLVVCLLTPATLSCMSNELCNIQGHWLVYAERIG